MEKKKNDNSKMKQTIRFSEMKHKTTFNTVLRKIFIQCTVIQYIITYVAYVPIVFVVEICRWSNENMTRKRKRWEYSCVDIYRYKWPLDMVLNHNNQNYSNHNCTLYKTYIQVWNLLVTGYGSLLSAQNF